MRYAEPFPSTGNKLFKRNHSFAQKHNMRIAGGNEMKGPNVTQTLKKNTFHYKSESWVSLFNSTVVEVLASWLRSLQLHVTWAIEPFLSISQSL